MEKRISREAGCAKPVKDATNRKIRRRSCIPSRTWTTTLDVEGRIVAKKSRQLTRKVSTGSRLLTLIQGVTDECRRKHNVS